MHMSDINTGAQHVERLNEAFEMTKLRKRYEKYIKLMQNMLKQFKTDENGVNIVKTFGMDSGFANAISSFFGFGKNAENKQVDVYIGVKPFARNVCRLIADNYKKSKTQFDSLVKNSSANDSTSNAKVINAATSILYEFFAEYMNADKLLKQGGIDITAKSTMTADTFKAYSNLINSYNPKNIGNNVQLFAKLSHSYDTMVQRFDTLGQRLTANFTKYFNKQMQDAGKDDEKIANALEGTQAKLSASWKAQTDLIKTDFPAVVQTILASPEYSAYYEFIIKEVLPKTKEFITGPTQPNEQPELGGPSIADIAKGDETSKQTNGTSIANEEPDKIPGYGISKEDIEAFVFDVPADNISASDAVPYDEDADLSEVNKPKNSVDASSRVAAPAAVPAHNSFIKVAKKNTSELYNLLEVRVAAICNRFKNLGVILAPGKIERPTQNELTAAPKVVKEQAGKTIEDIAKQVLGQENTTSKTTGESFSPNLIDCTTGVFETAGGINMLMNCGTLINETAANKIYVLISHCWGDGTYTNPEKSLALGMRNILKESESVCDVAKIVKNSRYLSLCEYNEQIRLNTYGKNELSFTAWNPMYAATAIITECNNTITGVKYIGCKKIVLY